MLDDSPEVDRAWDFAAHLQLQRMCGTLVRPGERQVIHAPKQTPPFSEITTNDGDYVTKARLFWATGVVHYNVIPLPDSFRL